MDALNDSFRLILNRFKGCLNEEELDKFGSVTIQDVNKAITEIQSLQETDRTMMDLTRVQDFLDRMTDLIELLGDLPDSSSYAAFIWGPMKMMLHSANQTHNAFDTLLGAYAEIGSKMPALRQYRATFNSHPDLLKVLEPIYEDILQFHQTMLRFLTHPNMRTLFRSMWNDYVPRFNTKLKNLESHAILIKQVSLLNCLPNVAPAPMNVQLVTGNTYERIDVSGGYAVIGDDYSGRGPTETMSTQILAKLADLERTLEHAQIDLECQERQRHNERLVRVQEWIAGPLPYRQHEKVCDVRSDYPETGLWIRRNDLISAWMNDDLPHNPILWMHGIPGSGKTVLASVIINECSKVINSTTAYFYCNYGDQESNTSLSILNSLLMQAIAWRPELTSYLDDQRQSSNEPNICRQRTAEKLTDLVYCSDNRVYIVIDGIDECALGERRSTLQFLHHLVQVNDQRGPGKLRLLIISQNEPDIEKLLATAKQLELQQNLNGDDIQLFVSRWTGKIGAKFRLTDEQMIDLERKTCWYARAQILYAKLVLENLYAQTTVSEYDEEVSANRFPKKLSEVYERIIERIKTNLFPAEWNRAQQLLGWMTCAVRPLKWHEMQGALSINFDQDTVDFDDRALRDRHARDLCGALVTVLDDRVSLVHQTARQYIAESSYIDTPLVESQLANLCIRYLQFQCFDSDNGPQDIREYVLEGWFAFADYATAKWMHHLYRVSEKAKDLSDPEKWNVRKDVMDELFESIVTFSETFHDDLLASQFDAEKRGIDTRLNAELVDLLAFTSTGNARPSFQMLWAHAEASRTGAVSGRHIITLQKLRTAMERIRETLEQVSSDQTLQEEEAKKLKTYYGDKVYRCSKTSCFFFHQGFKDRRTRDSHVARHDRPFFCPEAECPTADFGFADKKAFEAHILEAHPDSETKAKMFKVIPTKPRVTKYRCEPCDKSFARNSILQAHMRSHAGQKPHECSTCGKAFVRKNDCARHEKTVHNKIRAP